MGSAKPTELVLSSYSEWCLSHRICCMEDSVSIYIYIRIKINGNLCCWQFKQLLGSVEFVSDGKHIDPVCAYVRSDWPYIFFKCSFF